MSKTYKKREERPAIGTEQSRESVPQQEEQLWPVLFGQHEAEENRGAQLEERMQDRFQQHFTQSPESAGNSTAIVLRQQPASAQQDSEAGVGRGNPAQLKKLEEAIRVAEEQIANEQDPARRSRLADHLRRMQHHYNRRKNAPGNMPQEAELAEPQAEKVEALADEAPRVPTGKQPGLLSRIWSAIKGGAARVGRAVKGKASAIKRQHHRAVDALNNHREDYEAMPWFRRALWTLQNPLARISASRKKDDTRKRADHAEELEKKAMELAGYVRQGAGGYDLGDAAFDPLGMLEEPGAVHSVERERRQAEALAADQARMGQEPAAEEGAAQQVLAEEGAHGVESTVQNGVLHGVPKTLLSMGGLGVGLLTDTLTNVARAQDKVGILNAKLNVSTTNLSDPGPSNLSDQLKENMEIANLTGGERAIGIGSGLLQMGGAGMEMAGNVMKANSQRKKGDIAGTAAHSFEAMSSLGNFGIGLSKVVGYSSAAPGVVSTLGKEVIPGLGIATGAMKAISGSIQFRSARSTAQKMADRMQAMETAEMDRTPDQERMYRTFKQARGIAKANQVEGAMKIGSGVLNTTGNAMTLGGVTSLAGTIVSGAGTAVEMIGGMVGESMRKGVRTDTVNEELALEDKIKAFRKKDASITDRDAKHIILKAMGFSSGKRKEAFQHITMRRAMDLYQRAERGEDDAKAIVNDLGLSETGSGYSLQGISEKLGMSSNMSWQEQMRATKESRSHNPFKKREAA